MFIKIRVDHPSVLQSSVKVTVKSLCSEFCLLASCCLTKDWNLPPWLNVIFWEKKQLDFQQNGLFHFFWEMCKFFRVLYQHHLWSEANAVIRLWVVTWGGPVTLPASIICRKLQVTDNTHNIRAKPPEQSGSYLHFLRCAFLPVITCSSFPTFGVLYLYERLGSIVFHVSCPKSVW